MKILIEKAKVDRALEALKVARITIFDPTYAPIGWSASRLDEAFGILQEALADQPTPKQEQPNTLAWFTVSELNAWTAKNAGTDIPDLIAGALGVSRGTACDMMREALAEQPTCNPHPKAPHGFMRGASHGAGRFVCECEHWDAYDSGHQAGLEVGINAPPLVNSKQPQQPCKHEPEYADAFGAGYTFCKHCHKEWTTSMEGQ